MASDLFRIHLKTLPSRSRSNSRINLVLKLMKRALKRRQKTGPVNEHPHA